MISVDLLIAIIRITHKKISNMVFEIAEIILSLLSGIVNFTIIVLESVMMFPLTVIFL